MLEKLPTASIWRRQVDLTSVAMLLVLQAVYMLPLSIVGGFLDWLEYFQFRWSPTIVSITSSVLVTCAVVLLSLLTLSKRLRREDHSPLPIALAALLFGLGLLVIVFDHSELTLMIDLILAPIIEFLVSYCYLLVVLKPVT